jgi:hypothetical protein
MKPFVKRVLTNPTTLQLLISGLLFFANMVIVLVFVRWFYYEMLYYNLIGQKYFITGGIPYISFKFEHPPGAYLYFFLLSILSSQWFLLAYPLFNWVYVTAIGLRYKLISFTNLTDVLLVSLLAPYIFFRYDALPAALSFISYRLLISKKTILSGFLLGLSAIVKIYPIFLLPLSLISLWFGGKKERVKGIAKFFLGFGIGIGLPLIVLLFFRNPHIYKAVFTDVILYHGQRGVQCESILGSVYLLLHAGNIKEYLILNYGSWNVIGLPAVITSLESLVQIFVILFVWLIYYQKARHSSMSLERIYPVYALFIIMMYVILNKVFSPQYLLWPLFFFLEVKQSLVGKTEKYKNIPSVLYIGIASLTFIVISNYGKLLQGNDLIVSLVVLRNILLCLFIYTFFTRIKSIT